MNPLPVAPHPALALDANPIASKAPETRDVRVRRMVDAYFDPLWRFLRRLGVEPMDLDDAMQEVVEITASRLEDIPVPSERSFLFSTAFRVGGEFRRRRARRNEVGDETLANELDPGPEPDDLTDQARARQMLDELLAAMPTDLRAVFTLYEIEEMTMAEISLVLDISQGTVASRLRRAREQFEARVDRWQARMKSAERVRRKEITP
jgi:RNA polymerase sigma-70 factor (ECF subfamily)